MRTDTGLLAYVFGGYKIDDKGNIINLSPVLRNQRRNGKNYVKKKDRNEQSIKTKTNGDLCK